MKKKILITGASGFTGSFLIEEALAKNYEVYAGIGESSNKQYLGNKNINLIVLNFANTASLEKELQEAPTFDYIIHNSEITRSNKREDYFTVNYVYTKKFIETLIKNNKVPKKFIFISSLAAFGPGNRESLNPVKLTDIPKPITTYGRSKLEAEKFIFSLINFPYIIFRPTVVYGPREKDMFTFFDLIDKNFELYIGTRQQYFTFIHVKDLVRVIFLGIDSDIMNKSYFVSDGKVYRRRILGDIVKTNLRRRTIRISIPIIIVRTIAVILEFFYGIKGKTPILNLEKIKELESINWQCDVKPLKDDLNFEAGYDLSNGIKETIDWYKKFNWLYG